MKKSNCFVRFIGKVRPFRFVTGVAILEVVALDGFLKQGFLHRARFHLLAW